jgi:hypothetical protein
MGYGILKHMSRMDEFELVPIPSVSLNHIGKTGVGADVGLLRVSRATQSPRAVSPKHGYQLEIVSHISEDRLHIRIDYDPRRSSAVIADLVLSGMESGLRGLIADTGDGAVESEALSTTI